MKDRELLVIHHHMINLQNIQTEVDASFLYQILADHEEDTHVADIFRQMSEIEY